MSTMIDVYRNEIAMAVQSDDYKWLASIAKSFCERCHYYRPWKIIGVHAHVCPLDGLQARISIEFDDGTTGNVVVGYSNGKRRLVVNSEHIACESSADVVHALQTPCAFFDGIYYAVEGLADVARGDLKDQIAKWDAEAKQSRMAFERELSNIDHLHRSINKMSDKLKKAEESLAAVVESRRLVGDNRTWTLSPVDFDARTVEAQAMVALPLSEFVSLREAKDKLWGKSGVYFGWRVTDGKCVYVGKSENLGCRLNPKREKLIDCKITYIEMPADQIHTWELFYIWLHKPERNKELIEAAASAEKLSRQRRAKTAEATDGTQAR
jgi:hypothetical protein